MARRDFKLPGIQELNKDQEDVRALPLEGRHLIIGGPGTGKSVMALLRAKRLHEENKQYCFLVYNKMLEQASRQLFDIETGLDHRQWQSWFMQTFRRATGENSVPSLPEWTLNFLWDQILEIIASTKMDRSEKPYLIIDEGQDMPPEFYQCIYDLGFENLFVVADQNQKIIPGEGSNIDALRIELGLDASDVIDLKENYRNKFPVARLAREFYTDPRTLAPKLPPPTVQANAPLLYEYHEHKFSSIISRMVKMASNKPNTLIGLIAPNDQIRKRFYDALVAEKKNMSNEMEIEEFSISTYCNDMGASHIRFNEGGIMVINDKSCKGLEFDTVFIVGLNDYRLLSSPDFDESKKLFYVMVARAIDRVIMLKEKDRNCPVEKILPEDSQILERK